MGNTAAQATPCFGIDLGTTTSAIGWIVGGQPALIPVDGEILVPSVVCWPPAGPVLVGRAAVHAEARHPDRTLRSVKRRLATEATWTFDGRTVTPTDTSAAILRHLADGAEAAVGVRPRRVVITVPAWFTQDQRAETRRAGELAGLDVVRLLNEPTAAALAHAHGQEVRRSVLVYDLGGGTFDVSLVDQDGPVLEVRASHGDVALGGDDVDHALRAIVLAAQEPSVAARIDADPAASRRLNEACEDAKRALVSAAECTVRLPFLLDGSLHVEHTLRREDLEEVVLPLFARTTVAVDQVLTDAHRRPDQIDGLLLVGGSTHLPLIWAGLHKRYGLEGDARVPVQHAVALGAAVQAGLYDGAAVGQILVDVAPYSLSLGLAAGGVPGFPTHFVCEVVTPRNAALPARHTYLCRTGHPTQERLRFPVFQGSHPDPRRNVLIGEIEVNDLPPAPHDQLSRPIAVEFRHDLDGTVQIVVTDQLTGRTERGAVAADTTERDSLRARWEAWAVEHELVYGDPLDASDAGRAHLPEADALLAALRPHADAPGRIVDLVATLDRALEDRQAGAARLVLDALLDEQFLTGFYP